LDERTEKTVAEGERGLLGDLEEKVSHFLMKYQELKRERDELAATLSAEREKTVHLERRLELLAQDRDKVKTRIDQLLLRLKGIDM
jgi:chromosome segregation ATPase